MTLTSLITSFWNIEFLLDFNWFSQTPTLLREMEKIEHIISVEIFSAYKWTKSAEFVSSNEMSFWSTSN